MSSTPTPQDTSVADSLAAAALVRTALANAGRRDLADAAWAVLCPASSKMQDRADALQSAGYPFRTPPATGTCRVCGADGVVVAMTNDPFWHTMLACIDVEACQDRRAAREYELTVTAPETEG